MQAIFTRYYGYTATKPACVRAWASGNPSKRIRLSMDPEKTADQIHMEAAHKLAQELNWSGTWVEGSAGNDGYVYVLVNDERHSFKVCP